MMSMNLSNIAILNTKNADYCGIISEISTCGTINLMQNIDLTKKKGNITKHKHLLLHLKWVNKF